MLKVNEYEYGLGKNISETANEVYRLGEVPTDYQDYLKLVQDHLENQVPRIQMLNRYYIGQNDGIMYRDRRKDREKADYRTAHPFAENVTTFRTSYLVGKPVKTELVGDQYDDLNIWLEDWNVREDTDAHNLDLVTDLSKFGRAYELLYRGYDDQTHIAISNPEWTFVVYDETVQQEPLFAVRYPSVKRKGETLYQITVYLKDRTLEFEPTKIIGGKLTNPTVQFHAFGGIPIVEYGANRYRIGDYEKVLPMIDLYDYAQSDTGNYMTDTNESLMVVIGDFDPDTVTYDKEANMMLLPTGESSNGQQTSLSAQYIYPQYDVTGTESYKDRLRRDIYLFAYTPDMSDENFSANRSGEAMKYKLMGLEQDRAIKERLVRRGMARRYGLVISLSRSIHEISQDVNINDLVVTFTPNLPANLSQELPTLVNAGAKFSQATLLAQASFVDNVQDELEAVDKERQDNMAFMKAQMGGVDRHEHVLGETTETGDEGSSGEGPESTSGL